jgi:predicted Zn-dependent protease
MDGFGLVHSPDLARYLNDIRQKLVSHTGVNGVPGQVYVQATPEFNALATADGNIFISLGMINSLENEDEVAGIIAHELGHVLLRHHDADLFTLLQKQLVTFAKIGLDIKTGIDAKKGKTTGKSAFKSLRNMKSMMLLSEKVIAPAWNRSQEEEADLVAVDLLVKAGYNHEAMASALQKIQTWEGGQQKIDRMELARRTFTEHFVNEGLQKGQLEQAAKAAAVETAKSLLTDYFAGDHPDPEKRLETVSSYIGKYYAEAKLKPLQIKPWKAVRNNPQNRQVLDNYAQAFSLYSIPDEAVAQSERISSNSVRGFTSNHAYPLYLNYQLAREQGDGKRAFKALENALVSPEPSSLIYLELAKLYEESGKTREARAIIENAYLKFSEPPGFLPKLVRYRKLDGDKKSFNLAILKCMTHPDLFMECQREGASVKAGWPS